MQEGGTADLEVAFKMHPKPAEDSFIWVVNEDEDDEVRLKAGEAGAGRRRENNKMVTLLQQEG